MGYTAKRTIRQDFPELGPDIWAEIKNPALCGVDELETRRQPKIDKKGLVDREDAAMLAYEVLGNLLLDWHAPDPDDTGDDPISMPANADSLRKAPVDIGNWIAAQVREVTDPS